jgi:hypothetical protein
LRALACVQVEELMDCIAEADKDGFGRLLDQGTDVNQKDNDGMTPLHRWVRPPDGRPQRHASPRSLTGLHGHLGRQRLHRGGFGHGVPAHSAGRQRQRAGRRLVDPAARGGQLRWATARGHTGGCRRCAGSRRCLAVQAAGGSATRWWTPRPT